MQPTSLNDNHPLLRAKPLLRNIPLPPQPEVLRKVLAAYRQPTPDIHLIAELVGADVCLSGAVIQAVNAPLFGLRHTIVSIHQAITLLGLRRVLLLVRAVALRNGFGSNTECARFWQTASDMAHLSLLLAERLQLGDKENLYTVGLVHDCGMLLMMLHFPDYKTLLTQANHTSSLPVTAWEDEHYGLNHTDLGFLICMSWFLPPELCHAVAFHHKPFSETRHGRRQVESALNMLAVLKIVRHVHSCFRHMAYGDMEEPEWAQDSHPVLEYFGLSEPDFLSLRDELLDALENAPRGEY